MYIVKEFSVYYIFLSYVSAVLGSYVSMTLVDEVRLSETKKQFYFWLTCAAVAIGGAGIWTMHFIGMQSLSIEGRVVAYDITLTLASIVISIFVPWLALYFIAVHLNAQALGKKQIAYSRHWMVLRICVSGVCCGIGISGMHYSGMAAMVIDRGRPIYSPGVVVASVVIGLIASTAALWIVFFMRGITLRIIASFIMGIAVCGLHYTGMVAVNYVDDPTRALPVELPLHLIHGDSLGLYADVTSSVIRFLLLGLVYASELLRGRQIEDHYLIARGKLILYEPLVAEELPLPKKFSRKADGWSKFRAAFKLGASDALSLVQLYSNNNNNEQTNKQMGKSSGLDPHLPSTEVNPPLVKVNTLTMGIR
jgi:NO-binding membrane sensor protein with MHYT domain